MNSDLITQVKKASPAERHKLVCELMEAYSGSFDAIRLHYCSGCDVTECERNGSGTHIIFMNCTECDLEWCEKCDPTDTLTNEELDYFVCLKCKVAIEVTNN